jgi:hypothetical protein
LRIRGAYPLQRGMQRVRAQVSPDGRLATAR